MTETTGKSFNYRAFVSVFVGVSFLLMTVSGLVLFFAPSCRIARDTSWTVMGYDKDQWVALHVWFSIGFVVTSIFHIYFNWTALMTYFKSKITKSFTFRPEWIAVLVICGVVYAGTTLAVPPFSSLMAWQETFKHEGLGGGGHGRGRGREAREQMIVSDVNEQPQAAVHEEEHTPGAGRNRGGYGMGQKTLKQFCDEEGIELSSAISLLKKEGYTVRETMTMREIADSEGIHPRELRTLLQPEHQ
ncbi:MAG: DUF4405 domain-containing protein [Sedimentisphaerales bacterium]|nr:DUF4405 domain-containing protein [Sedimentisphaerales bacterium]